MAKLRLDLKETHRKGEDISLELETAINEALEKRLTVIEIVIGKNSEHLKKLVLKFLSRPHIKPKYNRIEKSGTQFFMVSVYFRHKINNAFHN